MPITQNIANIHTENSIWVDWLVLPPSEVKCCTEIEQRGKENRLLGRAPSVGRLRHSGTTWLFGLSAGRLALRSLAVLVDIEVIVPTPVGLGAHVASPLLLLGRHNRSLPGRAARLHLLELAHQPVGLVVLAGRVEPDDLVHDRPGVAGTRRERQSLGVDAHERERRVTRCRPEARAAPGIGASTGAARPRPRRRRRYDRRHDCLGHHRLGCRLGDRPRARPARPARPRALPPARAWPRPAPRHRRSRWR